MYIEYLPKALLDDITSNRCIPFIGAGFSKNAICNDNITILDWDGLGKKVAEYLPKYEYENAIETFSYYENEYSRANLIELVAQELHVNELSPSSAHISFCKLFFDLICTTNFDFLLETAFGELYAKESRPYHVISNEYRLSTYLNEKTTIIKLHGDFNEPNNMVITENDYDSYVTKKPLFCTYIANLLITRTPLLIGYSLNDPDIRMLWTIINSRLKSLCRAGYAIVLSASDNEISKFKRRGIKVINIPEKKENYTKVLTKLFDELYTHWYQKTKQNLVSSNDEAISILKYPKDNSGKFCFFSVPYEKLSLYKKYAFPIVEKYGFSPISIDDFALPGENITAKISTLISDSKIAIVDITTFNFNVGMELGIIKELKKPYVVISNTDEVFSDISNNLYIRGNFNEDISILLNGIEKFLINFITDNDKNNDEPKRLFALKEYNAAIISAIRLLEITLNNRLISAAYEDLKSSRPFIPLARLLSSIEQNDNIDKNRIREWLSIRNKVVHTNYSASKKQAKEIVEGIYIILDSLSK